MNRISSELLVNYNMGSLNNLTPLVNVSFCNETFIHLKFNDESNIFENLKILEFQGAKNLLGSFTSIVNLKSI